MQLLERGVQLLFHYLSGRKIYDFLRVGEPLTFTLQNRHNSYSGISENKYRSLINTYLKL